MSKLLEDGDDEHSWLPLRWLRIGLEQSSEHAGDILVRM